MKMTTISYFVGIGLIIWGLINFDLFKIVVGILLFLGGFAFYYFKGRKHVVANENEVSKVGKELFRQIGLFRDFARSNNISDSISKERLNNFYTAGYMVGFVDTKLSMIFNSDRDKAHYSANIYKGIFPQGGVELIKSKVTARLLYENIINNNYKQDRLKVNSNDAELFDMGMACGKEELLLWDKDVSYQPHKLVDYLSTGNV